MKEYLGLKLINAKIMNRLEYNNFRGWDLPENENGEDEGYLVEYMTGGEPNTEEYEGYVSWSPITVFEASYMELNSSDFDVPEDAEFSEGYQERVLLEYRELMIKINKLNAYIEDKEDYILATQVNYMAGYAMILERRIKLFKDN